MAVSKRLRYEILCRYCGLGAPEVKLTVDHVVPTSLGGSDEPSNLVAACRDCNAGKSASAPDAALVEDVDAKAVQWAQAMTLAIEQRAEELAGDRENTTWFDTAWSSWTRDGSPMPRDANWKNSILRFLAAGLDQEFLRDAIYTAMGNDRLPDSDRWRYFCGICWRELDTLREMTAAVMQKPPAEASSAADGRLPYGPGLHPEFDALNLADSFIADLLTHAGVEHEVVKWATRGFWDGMETAYKAFIDGPGSYESAEERASEEFSNATAWYMAQIRGLCQGQVPDGAE